MRLIWIVFTLAILFSIAGCASTSQKQFKQAQKDMQQGRYLAAFDQASRSLQSDIGNYKSIAVFSTIANGAYQQQLSKIDNFKSAQNWDQTAYGYDHIINMNQTVQNLQQALRTHMVSIQTSNTNRANVAQLLQLTPRQVDSQRQQAYTKAADTHYVRASTQAQLGTYRLAAASFRAAVSFIPSYKDAAVQAEKFKHLADLADAKALYEQGVQFVQTQQHRAAADAFAKALTFIPHYQDAAQLALKYKNIADQEGALKHYTAAQHFAARQQYREAQHEFTKVLTFVANYRNTQQLIIQYKDLADREDARKQYELAQQYMAQQNFQAASSAFNASLKFVPNFRDAYFMSQKAASYIPPSTYHLKRLVKASFASGIPHAYVPHIQDHHSIHDIKITRTSVRNRGRFDRYAEFWPYTIHVEGTFEFYSVVNGQKVEQTVPLDTDFYFHIVKVGRNAWKAVIR